MAFDVDEAGRVLAGWDDSGTVQLVEIEPGGSRTVLTALPGACHGRYVPGTRTVVVGHDTDGDEREQLSLLDLTTVPAEPVGLDGLTPLVRDPAHVNALLDVTATSVAYSTNRRNDIDFDVVLHDLGTGTERVLYDGGGYVTDVAVSHDETSVAITSLSLLPASTVVHVSGAHAVEGAQPTRKDDFAQHVSVHWAADDAGLLMASNHDREFVGIVCVSLDGGEWDWLVEDQAHDLDVWASRDGASMLVARSVDGAQEFAVHEADGALRCRVDLPGIGCRHLPNCVVWTADGGSIAITRSGPTEPPSIYLVDAHTGSSRRLVGPGHGEASTLAQCSDPDVLRIPTPDGERVPCFVFRPGPDADPALAGASVVHIHGGPEAPAVRQFNPLVAALATVGFTVLVPNVRGSTTYGKRWYSLDDVDKRLDSVADLAALHAHLPQLGLDPARSALWGASYGGYMVLAGVAMQPQLWAAGVDIVGISSLTTFLENTSGYRRAFREKEYGRLERDREFLVKASPITHLADILAPLFVIHGANDPRVPLSEARQIKAALDEVRVPCELRVYDDEGHGLAKRANRLDAYPAAVEFLVRHLARR